MNLEKLFWSKTKSDILKYLVFRRQGVSIRALESELGRTFPGIKKQIDALHDAEILTIEKTPEKRSIKIADDVYEEIRQLILCSLRQDTISLLSECQIISKFYLGKIFDKLIDVDLVVLHTATESIPEETRKSTQGGESEISTPTAIDWENLPSKHIDTLGQLKEAITMLFKSYLIDPAYLVFMPIDEFNKRTKMADKFALQVMRSNQ